MATNQPTPTAGNVNDIDQALPSDAPAWAIALIQSVNNLALKTDSGFDKIETSVQEQSTEVSQDVQSGGSLRVTVSEKDHWAIARLASRVRQLEDIHKKIEDYWLEDYCENLMFHRIDDPGHCVITDAASKACIDVIRKLGIFDFLGDGVCVSFTG